VDGILESDRSNESYCAVLSCGAVYFGVRHGGSGYIAFEYAVDS